MEKWVRPCLTENKSHFFTGLRRRVRLREGQTGHKWNELNLQLQALMKIYFKTQYDNSILLKKTEGAKKQ